MMDHDPIVRTVVVRCAPPRAFDVWTNGIASWWPLETHSLHGAEASTAVFETGAGGRIFETGPDGEKIWGEVVEWDPPQRVVYTWSPGREPARSTTVEVTFAPHEHGTLVRVEHRDWHRLGADTKRLHALYSSDKAWPAIFRSFAEAVA